MDQIKYFQQSDRNNILRLPGYLRKCVPAALLPWLINHGSLTRRLRQICAGKLQVEIIRQIWGKAYYEETQVLNIAPYCRVWQREVLLLCNNQPWVFARTIIPITTLQGPARRLLYLNNRPLGSVLFSDPSIMRGELEIFSLNASQYLYQQAIVFLLDQPKLLWGRRSLFWISHHPLLVIEVFLHQPNRK